MNTLKVNQVGFGNEAINKLSQLDYKNQMVNKVRNEMYAAKYLKQLWLFVVIFGLLPTLGLTLFGLKPVKRYKLIQLEKQALLEQLTNMEI